MEISRGLAGAPLKAHERSTIAALDMSAQAHGWNNSSMMCLSSVLQDVTACDGPDSLNIQAELSIPRVLARARTCMLVALFFEWC